MASSSGSHPIAPGLKPKAPSVCVYGPQLGYLGVTAELARAAVMYGLHASFQDPLEVSMTLPRSPSESTFYDIGAEVCLAINLLQFSNSGGQVVAYAKNQTAILYSQVRPGDFFAAVCKKTGWNYLTAEYVYATGRGTPPDYPSLIREAYKKCDPAKLSEVDHLLKEYRGAHWYLYANICFKYNLVPHKSVQPTVVRDFAVSCILGSHVSGQDMPH